MKMRVCVIDGNPLVYRSDSVSDLTTPQGVRVSGVYGALDILQMAVESLAPTHLMMVWDWKREDLWRRYMYSDYKMNRECKTPEEIQKRAALHEQIKLTYKILRHFPVRQFLQYGMEGDDLAYWVTKRMCPLGASVKEPEYVCITVDRDWLQLVDERTKVYFSDSQTLVDRVNFPKISGCPTAEDFLVRKSILGDTGDNVKGVVGVGPKTYDAVKENCCTIEDFAAAIPKVEEQFDQAQFSRLMVDLSKFPYTKDLDDLLHHACLPNPDLVAARKIFEELKFTHFLSIWKTWTRTFRGLQI
jgi:DNA polymerase I